MTDEAEKPKLPKLNRRELRLCELYLTGLKGVQCLRAMGDKREPHRVTDAAYKMLNRPHVKAYLAERRRDLSEATGVRAEQIVRELAHLGFGNLKSLYNETGNLIAINELPDEASAMLSGIDVEELFEGRGEDREHIGHLRKVRIHNKVDALEKLAKILGFLKEKVEIDLNAPAPVITIMPYEDADEAEREARASVSRNSPAT
jgi:phage terminase small subunit